LPPKPSRIAASGGARREIQGLRAVAVLAVIGDHLSGWPRGGFVGVDVFFVISGYLITALLLREHERSGTISYRRFYARRIKRILPASALVLVSTAVAARFLLSSDRFAQTMRDEVWAFCFAANWHFAAVGTDYFQQGRPPSAVQHFWSLAVEEQFYVVWPMLLLVLLTALARFKRQRRLLGAVVLAIVFASFGWALRQTAIAPNAAYFSTFSRAWEVGVGAGVAVLGVGSAGVCSAAVRASGAWLGVVGIAVSLFVVPSASGFPAPWAALPVLATALVLGLGDGVPLWPLTNAASRYVGDLSYSLYLWHFPVVVLLLGVLPGETVGYYTAAIGLMLALSIASYHLIEDPARRSAWLTAGPHLSRAHRPSPRRVLIGAAAVAAVVATVAAGLTVQAPRTSSSLAEAAAIQALQAVPESCLGAAAMDPAQTCSATALGDALVPSVDGSEDDTADAFDCWMDPDEALRSCSYGSTDPSALRVAIVGDSHAAMLLPGLKAQLVANNWRLDTYLGWGCLWMPSGTVPHCDATMAQIQRRLVSGPKYDVVITSGARQKSPSDKAKVSALMAQAWAPVAARGTKIAVVGDNPGVPASTLQCLSRIGFSPSSSDCATSRSTALSVVDPLVKAAGMVTGARLIDLTSFYCDAQRCPAVIGHVVTYRDTVGHLTATYSRTLAPYLVAAVGKLGSPSS
jgi:peptidoglycan/LPS O-acetylase OafA/YrhL